MAQTAQNVIDKAKIILQEDEAQVHWDDMELLGWLNSGQRELVREKPDANPVMQTVQLAAGPTQDLPVGSILLLDVTCNMGITGTTPGNAVTVIERNLMDKIMPSWRTVTADDTVLNVIYDSKRLPKKFWVYPQSPGDNYLEIVTADLPADIARKDALTVGDEYALALMHFVIAMAMTKDADYVLNEQRAIAHYNQFLTSIGVLKKDETDKPAIKTWSNP